MCSIAPPIGLGHDEQRVGAVTRKAHVWQAHISPPIEARMVGWRSGVLSRPCLSLKCHNRHAKNVRQIRLLALWGLSVKNHLKHLETNYFRRNARIPRRAVQIVKCITAIAMLNKKPVQKRLEARTPKSRQEPNVSVACHKLGRPNQRSQNRKKKQSC